MIPVVINMRFSRPAGTTIRQWREGMREAYTIMAMTWHREMLPDHFTTQAKFKYGHKPRSREYLQDKVNAAIHGTGRYRKRILGDNESPPRFGGAVDNVFSGRMMDMLLGQTPAVRAFPTRVRLDYKGPEYLMQRPKKSNQPDKWGEITRVTPDQVRRLGEVVKREVLRRFNGAVQEPVNIRITA